MSRRTFLAAGAGALVLAACGGGGSGDGDGPTALAARYEDGYFTPGTQRVAVSLGNKDGLISSGVPQSLDLNVLDASGKVVVPSVTAPSHAADTPLPYYAVPLSLTTPGVYTLSTQLSGRDLTASFSVVNPAKVQIPQPGQKLPPFDTPTTDNNRGVNPICTRQPMCTLHDQTLTAALQSGKPVAYLIGTPAFCQTGVCAPILDNLLTAHAAVGDRVAMVHSEVYSDNTATTPAPAVSAYHMTFEPCLWVTDASGTIVERLDFVFDQGEINAALAKVTA